jgi:hypothetical protein
LRQLGQYAAGAFSGPPSEIAVRRRHATEARKTVTPANVAGSVDFTPNNMLCTYGVSIESSRHADPRAIKRQTQTWLTTNLKASLCFGPRAMRTPIS